jgi:hypothetical protein
LLADCKVETPVFHLPYSYFASAVEVRAPLLTLNADVSWPGKMVTGGCDEGCAAYVLAELLDDATGAVLPGFGRADFAAIMDVDGPALPLHWRAAPRLQPSGVGGLASLVRLRLLFRDATIYSLQMP